MIYYFYIMLCYDYFAGWYCPRYCATVSPPPARCGLAFEMTVASTDPGLYCCVLELSAGLYTPKPMVNALYGSLDTIVRIIAKEATAITATTNGNAKSITSIPYFILEDVVVGRENTPTI